MISCAKIAAIVAARCDLPVAVVAHGRNRSRKCVRARQIAIYLARTVRGLSYPVIGRSFRKDHTTCMHAVNMVRRRSIDGSEFAALVEECREDVVLAASEANERIRNMRITAALQLPTVITTTQVLDLTGKSAPTMARTVYAGLLPRPITKTSSGMRLYDRDAVLRALGLLPKIAVEPQNEPLQEQAAPC